MTNNDLSTIIHKTSGIDGPCIALMAGVHGNETAGIIALKKIIDNLSLKKGEVYIIFGNPRAIEQGVRFTEKNLNRCFTKGNEGQTYEDMRAREIMKILDTADALLDIHASNTPESEPFIICEDNALPIARTLDFGILSTGWDAIEPGASDGYMFQQGKVGICAECGYAEKGEDYADLAYDTVMRFLGYYDMVTYVSSTDPQSQKRHLHVDEIIMKERADFEFSKLYADFETIPQGVIFARDGDREYATNKERVIVFANPHKEVGGEACILGFWK